ADHSQPVLVGNQIGFTVTVANNGEGTAFAVHVDDALPVGFNWTIQSQNGSLTWSIVGGNLVADGDMPGSSTSSVHIVSGTDAADCGVVPNTANLSQFVNEQKVPVGSDDASEAVRCPALTIDKSVSGNTGGTNDSGVPIAIIGDTLTYHLKYTL